MSKLSVVVIILASVLISACQVVLPDSLGDILPLKRIEGSGNVVNEARPASDFSSVRVEGMGRLVLVQGEDEGLAIETDDNLLQYITSEVRDGTLVLGVSHEPRRLILDPSESIVYTLRFKSLDQLDCSGATDVIASSLATGDLSINISGAAAITIDELAAQTLSVALSGVGDIRLSGEAEQQTIEFSGVGDYSAGSLESKRVKVRITGGGLVTLWATDSLEVEITGAGSVRYYGSPAIQQEISGAGSVTRLGSR